MDRDEFQSRNQPPLDQQFTRGRFAGKLVLVSGGASGIGYAVAERFASDGARVAILDVDAAKMDAAKKGFDSEGGLLGHGSCDVYACDVTDKAKVDAVVKRAAERHRGADDVGSPTEASIDCLVTCAAYFGSQGSFYGL